MSGRQDQKISLLLEQLASLDRKIAQDAQWGLENFGIKIVPKVLKILPSLNWFSQRCAIELIQRCKRNQLLKVTDPSIPDVFLPLLESNDQVVREWVAQTLGWLRIKKAIPALLLAQERAKAAKIPLGWSEPETLRLALTDLGAREEVMPPQVGQLAQEKEKLRRCWAVKDLELVVSCLCDAQQVVLYFGIWEMEIEQDGSMHFYWQESPSYNLDLTAPWPQLVQESRLAALNAVKKVQSNENLFANISWIDESDR